ncbi:MAG: 3-hydroxyacyl-ACP dehydratase FabZ [Eubacteriales bacterium]|nr:3-hydroxyacyl-ACP dehydratase FabZ [Eubacteriales bacterium]MDD3349329.1 3-hydroxyacyl-ACP dehydratase FabZ [Eubacteriales bacterium]
MDSMELERILPHRKPMLLLDEAEKIGENKGTARYTVKGDEFFLQGHFPGNPVVPGVIQCEMMAQACGVILSEETEGKTPFFTSIEKVRFKQPVRPGDTIEFACEITKSKKPFYFASGRGTVNGKLCIEGSISFALIDR